MLYNIYMWTYIIIGVVIALAVLLCLALAVASFSFENYYSKFKEIDRIGNSMKVSTLSYVGAINKKYFDGRLKVMQCAQFEDHYSTGVVALSGTTMASNSLASLAIVSHELGHARQDFSGDTLKKHWKMRRAGRICGLFFLPFILIGAVLSLLWVFKVLPEVLYIAIGGACLVFGFLIFVFALVLKYREIKIEKEASDFALEFLQELLEEDEIKSCKELLNSARLTYWAALIRTLLSWTMLTKKDKMFK